MQQIPLDKWINQELLITLDDYDCKIAVYERNERLFLDITVNGEAIQQGALVQSGIGIVQVAQNGFDGQLVVIDTGNQALEQQPPRYTGLDSRWVLYYLSPEEVAASDAWWKEQALAK